MSDLLTRLRDEADLCRNDGANDIAQLLDAAALYAETLERLLAERERLLRTIPACPEHGDQCVPHAIEWVRLHLVTETEVREANADNVKLRRQISEMQVTVESFERQMRAANSRAARYYELAESVQSELADCEENK